MRLWSSLVRTGASQAPNPGPNPGGRTISRFFLFIGPAVFRNDTIFGCLNHRIQSLGEFSKVQVRTLRRSVDVLIDVRREFVMVHSSPATRFRVFFFVGLDLFICSLLLL